MADDNFKTNPIVLTFGKVVGPCLATVFISYQAFRLVLALGARRLLCEVIGHYRIVDRRFDGPIGGLVEIVGCGRCPCQWVVTDQETIRYDNDPEARAGILRTYPNLRQADLSVSYSD